MSLPSPTSRLIGPQRFPRTTTRAFSLVELMMGILIISILFAFAVPSYQRIQRKARASAVANDFRVFGAIFQTYAHEKGSWPVESSAGVVPPGLTNQEIQAAVWTKITAMGGKFDWENNQAHPGGTSPGGKWRAAIAITAPTDGSAPLNIDADLMEEIDRLFDDGNLNSGIFRKGFGDCPILIIEQ